MTKLNHLVLFFFLVVSSFSNAQLEKGMYFIGGAANINVRNSTDSPEKSFSLNLYPCAGKVLDKNWLLGGCLNIVYSTNSYNNQLNPRYFGIGASPFVRKYFQTKKMNNCTFFCISKQGIFLICQVVSLILSFIVI